MRNKLVLSLVAALAVAAVESLDCEKCSSYSPGCNGDISTCPEGSQSCGFTLASWPAEVGQFYEKFCSEEKPGSEWSFAVRVPGDQPALFADKFCTEGEACEPALPEGFPENGTGDTQCPTCLELDADSCNGAPQTCNAEERCVDLLAEVITVKGPQKLALMGCSDVSETLCSRETQFNIGKITIYHLTCDDTEPIQTPDSNTTTSPSTISNSSSSSNTTTFTSTTSSSVLSQAAKLPWIASLVLGLLLL